MNNQFGDERGSAPARVRPFLAGLVFGNLIGLLLGSLIGASTMLLLAPRTGKQTRARIQKQGAALRLQASERIDDMMEDAGDRVHQFTDGVQTGVDEFQQHAQELIGQGKEKS